MGFMFYVPACLVGHVRRGLFAELVLAGGEIQSLACTAAGEESMEELRLLVACVDGAWALFGVLGCSAAVDPVGVEVDLRVHRWTLQLALHHEIERYEGLVARAREDGACARRRGLERRREILCELRRAVEIHASGLDDPAEAWGLEWGPGGGLSVGEWAILHLLLEDSTDSAQEHDEAPVLTPSCVA